MTRSRNLPWFALACAFCLLPALSAQISTVTPRVTGPVDESSLMTLKGSLIVLAQPQYDRGEAAPATELHNVRLVVHRSAQQEADLESFMAEQIDRNSPNYHHWLTPSEFDRLYGLADSDSAAIVAWLQSHGLRLGRVSGTDISFSGTVAQLEEAFHTTIHSFAIPDGREFLSNTTEPRIPAAFSQVITGVAFLDTLQPRSHAVRGTSGTYDSAQHKMVPAHPTGSRAHPDLTTGSSPNQFLWLVPADAATIYDSPNSLNGNFNSGSTYNGSGVTIGIGGDSAIQTSTVADFRTRFLNGDTSTPTVIDVGAASGHPAQVNSDQDEAYLDNELAGGLAPKAAIRFYVSDRVTTNGIFDAIPQMITDNKVDIFSLSFGECELYNTTAANAQIEQWWQEASALGIAVVVSTGDSGSAGCDNPDSATSASLGLAVSGFATTPYNIAVGGTDFYPLVNNFSTYANNNQSPPYYASALSYIPESPWNDSSSTLPPGPLSGNVESVDPTTKKTNIIGGSGGESTCSTNTSSFNTQGQFVAGTCTSGYAQPSWQRGTGVPTHGHRDIPDVSLLADNGYYSSAWAVCTDDTGTNQNNQTVTANCTDQVDGNFYWEGIGGTSASTPAFAGILAMLTQKAGGRIGLDGAKFLYDLYNGGHAGFFNDVTVGNNSVVCTSGTPNCNMVSTGNYFMSGYNAGAGYDLATGLGSVDASKLIAAYASSLGTAKATVTATPDSNSITTSDSLSLAVSVTGSSGTPTGTVTVSGDGYTSSAEALVAGAVTITIPAGSLNVANNATLTVSYSGDSTYAQASGTAQITVTGGSTKLTPTVTVTPASNAIDTAQSLDVTVKVDGGTGNPTPTGTITLQAGSFTSSAMPLDKNGSVSFTIPANSFSGGGSGMISAGYSGDVNYNSTNGAFTETITLSTFTVAASTPGALNHASGSTTTASTVTVSAVADYAGSISLSCALTTSPSGASDLPSCAITAGNPVSLTSSTTKATATATVSITQATSSSLDKRGLPGWLDAGSGTALALLVFFGIPARRRVWRNLLGALAILGVLGTLSACGGGGSNGGGGNPGTTPGSYTFTITGQGTPSTGTSVTATFTVKVN